MRRLIPGLVVGSLAAGLGAFFVLTPLGAALEESVGLWALFNLRGPRPHPPEVVVVSVDRWSAERLGLPGDVAKWPRSYHARLTDGLARAGAAVIVFDIYFAESGRLEEEDRLFADAIARAGNVVLSAYLARETLPVPRPGSTAQVHLERLLPPLHVLAGAAAATAPFPLPKAPLEISQYWAFKTTAGDTPTLPVVALQIYTRDAWPDFLNLIREASPAAWARLASAAKEGHEPLPRTMARIRDALRADPRAASRLGQRLATAALDPERRRRLEGLLRLYLGPDSLYLDLYGPARTIRTVPYHELIQASQTETLPADLRGTVVFVGVSETLRLEQRDGFRTAFSEAGGVETSGVELAATALANFLEGRHVRPLPVPLAVAATLAWGLLLGLGCALLSPLAAAGTTLVAGGLWLAAAHARFTADATWWPWVVPLLVQAPVALVASLAWRFVEGGRERQRLRRAFSLYVPGEFIEEMLRETASAAGRGRVVSGVCLATDAGRYTALAETMEPEALANFMNRYFAAVFAPIRRQGGIISDVIGDSALAIWTADELTPHLRRRACAAAWDIVEAMDRFNREPGHPPLPTRLGLHAGPIALGNVGAMDHYEYRATGDTVNSATRIEGLNKHLGTRALASEEVVVGGDAFLTRRLGTFLLAGKSQPLVLHELLGPVAARDEQADRFAPFAEALAAWEDGAWTEARRRFAKAVESHPDDGAARFYLQLCERRLREPAEGGDGVIVQVASK